MKRQRTLISTAGAALFAATLVGQDPSCQGGAGQAYIRHSQARIGGTLDIEVGSPAAPGGFGVISVSDGFGPVNFPGPQFGTICLDVFSPAYFTQLLLLDGAGSGSISVSIPNDPSLETQFVPLFLNGLAVENGPSNPTLALSNTVRLEWRNPDGFKPVANTMQEGRSMHSATSLHRFPGDRRTAVLIAGGGGGNFMQPNPTATTELYQPLTQSFVPGPSMNVPRASHEATRLQDGRVLLSGGASVNAAGTATCEIYDPDTDTFTVAASMSTPRMGHRATLMNDGRVFVSGGFTTFENAVTQFGTVLATTQDTTEIYDPVTDTWSPGPTMGSTRTGHGQLIAQTGQILIFGGINGWLFTSSGGFPGSNQAPSYTNLTEAYDPATNTVATVTTMRVVRAFFGYSWVPTGVLVTGGFAPDGSTGAAVASNRCELFDGFTWTNVGNLPGFSTAAGHPQVTAADGTVLLFGGFTGNLTQLAGSDEVIRHDALVASPGVQLGFNPVAPNPIFASAFHTVTEMHDGTYLLVGGTHLLQARNDGWIFQP